MKWKFLLLITIFVPTISFAGFGESFNSLLERFFSGTEPTSAEEVLSIPEPQILPSEVQTPEDVKKAILQEEDALESIERSLYKNQESLENLKDEHALVQYQLEQLDGDLGAVRSMQEARHQAVVKWRRELEEITRKKATIEATMRYEKKEQETSLSKNFIQSSLQKNDETIDMWNWIFSNDSLSHFIEKRRRQQEEERAQAEMMAQLKTQQQNSSAEEQRVAAILFHVQELERQSAQQQMLLSDLVSARANVAAHLQFSQGELENAIDLARQQQSQSTIALQALREQLTDKTKADISEPQEMEKKPKKMAFPLPLPPVVTAHFLDPEYKKALGRDHFGTDFEAPQGTPILAPMDGVIKKIAQNGYAYSYLIVDHGDDLFTLYGHISDVTVSEGDSVVQGQEIAKTGGTPGMPGSGFFTTGPHLHFEVFAGGRHVDAEKWLNI